MKTNKDTKTNKSLVEQAFINAYDRICDIKQRIAALHYACNNLRQKSYGSEGAKEDFSSLHSFLYQELNEAYNTMFVFSVVSGDRELLSKAKELAFDRYLKENTTIMQYLGFEGSYSADLEREFRNELKTLKDNK